MGLDNYFVVPNHDDTNSAKYVDQVEKALEQKLNGLEPNANDFDFEHHNAYYDGKRPINLVGGMFSDNGNDGSFRGKVYSSLCDALLKDAISIRSGFLYSCHFDFEIVEAYSYMEEHHKMLLDNPEHWNKFKDECLEDGYHIGDISLEEALDFLAMFEYFSGVDNIFLIASY
jgi:hypothetical protein